MLVFIIMSKKKPVKKKVVKKKKYSDKIYKSSVIPFLSLDYDEKRYADSIEEEFYNQRIGMIRWTIFTFLINFVSGFMFSLECKRVNYKDALNAIEHMSEEEILKEYKEKRNIDIDSVNENSFNDTLEICIDSKLDFIFDSEIKYTKGVLAMTNIVKYILKKVSYKDNIKNTNLIKLLVYHKFLKIESNQVFIKDSKGWVQYEKFTFPTSNLFQRNYFGMSKYFNLDKNPDWLSTRRKEWFIKTFKYFVASLGVAITLPMVTMLYLSIKACSPCILKSKIDILKKMILTNNNYSNQDLDEVYNDINMDSLDFGRKRNKRKVKKRKKRKVKKIPASLKKKCKRLKIRLTLKKGGKRVYKSETMLKKQCSNKSKKK